MQILFRQRKLLRGLLILALVLLVLVLLGQALAFLTPWLRVAILAGAIVVLLVLLKWGMRWVPSRTMLELDLERGVLEHVPPRPPFAAARKGPYALADVLDALERAGSDARVVGLVARVGAFRPGMAVAQELREAVLAFRARGKKAVAFAETIGEGASTSPEVFVASAFDQVCLQPSGLVGFDGLLLRHPFVKDTLAKVGVDPQLGNRRAYKTAKNLFTERSFTPEHRESVEAILEDATSQIVEGVAEGRALAPEVVRELIDRGPFTAKEAVDAGLVDRLCWRDELYEELRDDGKTSFLYLEHYLKRARRPHRKGHLVALVQGTGSIHRGAGKAGGGSIGSDDVAKAIRKAAKAKKVAAILFRVDSPGGSAVASETIWREVEQAKAKGKKVVVSMGNVAGSGGYYVACGADRIVADPATLTGSIGVVWGKFVTREAWAKLGVTWDAVKAGKNADLWSPVEDFGEKGWERLQGLLDTVYADFKEKVAAGRGLDAAKVEEVAQGRVWTGVRAKALGLVDELGGRTKALAVLREVAGLGADAPLRLKTYHPKRRGPFAAVTSESSSEAVLRRVGAVLGAIDPGFAWAIDEARAAHGGPGVLMMPPHLL